MATIPLRDEKVLVIKLIRDVNVLFWSAYDLGTSHKIENGTDKDWLESLFLKGEVVYFLPSCNGELLLTGKLIKLSDLLEPFGVVKLPVKLTLVMNIVA